MRAGLSTIQQTLTPEAASVLNHSIAEAGRRNHGQTTPLHVAATLLSSPTGFLRQACIRSHPNSSHPLQCRALELCFSVALERLPTAQNMAPGMEPPISNALMAALKRAQAHQRRGCPEQQQQPLLAVKVELEQLIISILDDPSVSRVMREASFSSPAVKATIEQSLNSNSSHPHHHQQQQHPHHYLNPHGNSNLGSFGGIGSRMLSSPTPQLGPPTPSSVPIPNRNMYLNPRLQQGVSGQSGTQRNEEVKKVLDIFTKSKKRNPVLVGEGEPEAVVKELLRRIEKGELSGEGCLKNVQVVQFEKGLVWDKNQLPGKINELGGLIESRISNGGIIVNLGDLKWLVEQPVSFGVAASGVVQGQQQQQPVVSEAGRAAVVEMGKLLARFEESNNNNNKIWLIGTATCETYLRCQVYHPTMENDWDLQAVPIASRSPLPAMFPRLGTDRILGNPGEPLSALKSFPTAMPTLSSRLAENLNAAKKLSCCPQCSEKYEEELGNLAKEFENSCSDVKSGATRPPLPQWLQNAKTQDNHVNGSDPSLGKDKELRKKHKSQELQKKWHETCLRLHPNFHNSISSERTASPALSLPGLRNPNLVVPQPFQPKLLVNRNLGEAPRLNENPVTLQSSRLAGSPPGSPVRTDLVLGRKVTEPAPEKTTEGQVKDFLGCVSSEPQTKSLGKFANALDAETFKKLLKGLMEKAWWQAEAASRVASAVTRCRLGNGKQRGVGSRGDIWLLFTGPDRIGKRKMASVLSEQVCGASPVMICLGLRRDYDESETNFRGKTALDRIAEAVRRNPFSVIMIEDIDEADILVRGSIKRAIDRGRLTDSHGREISLGNVIFVVTGNWSTVSSEDNGNWVDDRIRNGNWNLRLTVSEKSAKRRVNWLHDDDRATKPRKELNSGLSLDLNLAADTDDDRTDGSHNSSDLTNDHEGELGLDDRQFVITAAPHDLVNAVDDAIVFKPVDFAFVRREIRKTITKKFSMVVDDKISLQVEDAAVEKIIGGLWHGKSSLEQWVEKVLAPSFDQLESQLQSVHDNLRVGLALDPDTDYDGFNNGDPLPAKIKIISEAIRN